MEPIGCPIEIFSHKRILSNKKRVKTSGRSFNLGPINAGNFEPDNDPYFQTMRHNPLNL